MEVELCMNYIIADPDIENGVELRKILDDYEILDFQGSYTAVGAVEQACLKHPPDLAFILLGKAELNAFRLAGAIRERNPSSKIIFISSRKETAVEAFEYEADGFLLTPFNKKKIEQLLQQKIGNDKYKKGCTK
jgi:DNA-binding LytR/AlgR family response regulator